MEHTKERKCSRYDKNRVIILKFIFRLIECYQLIDKFGKIVSSAVREFTSHYKGKLFNYVYCTGKANAQTYFFFPVLLGISLIITGLM